MNAVLERLEAVIAGEAPSRLAPVGELVGMTVVAAEAGRVVFALEAGPQHGNPMGTVHGGILATLADSAMGMAYATTLGEGESFTTLELKVNFLRPVWRGRLEAEGRITSAGRTTALTECRITDAQGRLVAHATSTCLKLEGERAAGR